MQVESSPRQGIRQTGLFFIWASDPVLYVLGLPVPFPMISTHLSTSKSWKTMGFLASMRPSFGFCFYRMTPAFYQRWVTMKSPSDCLPGERNRGRVSEVCLQRTAWGVLAWGGVMVQCWPFWSLYDFAGLWYTGNDGPVWDGNNNVGYWLLECLLHT